MVDQISKAVDSSYHSVGCVCRFTHRRKLLLGPRLKHSQFLTSLIKTRLLLSPSTFQKASYLHFTKCHNLMPLDAFPHAHISSKIAVGWMLVKN